LEILDYSESLIRVMRFKKLCHAALLDKKWAKAAEYSDEILRSSVQIRRFCEAQKAASPSGQ